MTDSAALRRLGRRRRCDAGLRRERGCGRATARRGERLATALGADGRVDVALERPSDPEHGDFATTVALRLAPVLRRAAARGRRRARRAGRPRRPRGAGRGRRVPASSTCASPPPGTGPRSPSCSRPAIATAPARPSGRSASRSRWCRRTRPGPITVAAARNGAYGDSVARLLEFAGHDVEREYYYNDAGSPDGAVPSLRRGAPARRGAARGRLPRRVHRRSSRCSTATPCRQMLEQIEATLERFRIHFDAGRARASSSASCPSCSAAARHVRARRRGLGRARPSTATRRTGCCIRSPERGGLAHLRGCGHRLPRDKLERGFDRVIYVLGADHHGIRRLVRGGRAHARLRPGARGGAALPARPPDPGGRGDEDVEATRRRRVPRRAAGRDRRRRRPLVPRQPRPRPDDRDRRRPGRARRARRTPSTTSSTRTRGSPASCATRARRAPSPSRRHELAPRSGSSSSGSSSSRPSSPRRRSGAGPHAIPVYAIRLADDFHRFYHHNRVLGSEAEAFRLALCRGDAGVIARCLDLVGVERARADVSCWRPARARFAEYPARR